MSFALCLKDVQHGYKANDPFVALSFALWSRWKRRNILIQYSYTYTFTKVLKYHLWANIQSHFVSNIHVFTTNNPIPIPEIFIIPEATARSAVPGVSPGRGY